MRSYVSLLKLVQLSLTRKAGLADGASGCMEGHLSALLRVVRPTSAPSPDIHAAVAVRTLGDQRRISTRRPTWYRLQQLDGVLNAPTSFSPSDDSLSQMTPPFTLCLWHDAT